MGFLYRGARCLLGPLHSARAEPNGPPPRTYTAADYIGFVTADGGIVHGLAGSAVAGVLAMHVLSDGAVGPREAMAVVLAALAASGTAAFLGGLRRDWDFETRHGG